MTVTKGELRAAAIHDFGVRLDDSREKEIAIIAENDGAARALRAAASGVAQLHAMVDKDVDEGRVDLVVAKYAKDLLTRYSVTIDGNARGAAERAMVAKGRHEKIVEIVTLAKQTYELEIARSRPAQVVGVETVDREAPRSLKSERLAETDVEPSPATKTTQSRKRTRGADA